MSPVAASWTDREWELSGLTVWIAAQPDYAVPVVLVHGPIGVGKKTAIAGRLTHRLAGLWPGGHFSDELGGAGLGPRVSDVLARLVQPGPQPVGVDELASWWRSATVARSPVCLLPDDVTYADQIRAWSPGGAGLAAEGAARAYLSRCPGPCRIHQDPKAVTRLIALTASVPVVFVLSISQLASNLARSLAAVDGALDASRDRGAATSPAPTALEPSRPPRSAPRTPTGWGERRTTNSSRTMPSCGPHAAPRCSAMARRLPDKVKDAVSLHTHAREQYSTFGAMDAERIRRELEAVQ